MEKILSKFIYPLKMWLCPVTTFIFEEYPNKFYVR